MHRAIAAVLILSAFAGCAGNNDGYPALVPENTIIRDEPLTPDPAPHLNAQADALRARAAAIRAEAP